MMWPDRIYVTVGGGTNSDGDPIPKHDEGPFPAQVTPLRSSESVAFGAVPLTAYYRVHVGKEAGDLLTSTAAIKWGGRAYAVQGDVEPWHVNGRLHHYEATVQKT